MITVAPEWEGSEEFIRTVTREGTVVTLGHTDCDYDTAIRAIEAGANCLTHTFNAMNPLHPRRPGPIPQKARQGLPMPRQTFIFCPCEPPVQ